MNWTEVEALANTCLVLTSAGAIGYAALQLRHEREYRSVSNLEKQLAYFQSPGFTETRRRLAQERLTEDREALRSWAPEVPPASAFEVLDFFEHVGLLVKKGHLELYDVWHTFYEWAQPVYVDMQRVIEDDASVYVDHYGDLRRLMRQMDDLQLGKMYRKNAKSNHWALWTPDRIVKHYRYELEVAGHSRRGKRAAQRRERTEDARVDLDASAEGVKPDASVAAARERWERMRHAGGK